MSRPKIAKTSHRKTAAAKAADVEKANVRAQRVGIVDITPALSTKNRLVTAATHKAISCARRVQKGNPFTLGPESTLKDKQRYNAVATRLAKDRKWLADRGVQLAS